MINKLYFPGLLISCVIISSAVADTQLTSTFSSSNQSTPETATLLMKQGKLALQDNKGVINGFYDSHKDVVFAVDHSQKSYYEINRALATTVGHQLNSVMTTMSQQMEKAMAGMSEEQKKQFQSVMPGVLTNKATPAPTQVSIRETGKSVNVAGVRCTITELLEAQQPAQHVCVASYGDAGLSDEEIQSLKKLGLFAGELAHLANLGGVQPGQINPASYASAFDKMKGIPLSVSSSDGYSGQVTAITHNRVANSVFTIPNGYQKKDVLSLLRGFGH